MKDGDRKKFEKKKEFRNVEEFKKENEKYSKYDIKKFNNQYSEPTTEKFLKNEVCILIPSVSAIQFYFLLFFQKDQLCQSLDEDNVKNSLLKFGLITHLIEDVTKFKKSMKTMSGTSQKIGFKSKPDKPLKARARTDKEVKSAVIFY